MIDYLIFYILDLIRRHGRIDAFYTGKHKLEGTMQHKSTFQLDNKQLTTLFSLKIV